MRSDEAIPRGMVVGGSRVPVRGANPDLGPRSKLEVIARALGPGLGRVRAIFALISPIDLTPKMTHTSLRKIRLILSLSTDLRNMTSLASHRHAL